MKYNRLGNSDLNVSEVCLGTMTFGEQNSLQEARRQLDFALGEGVNFLDTAEMYPVPAKPETVGRTEEYVGDWLKGRQREKIILASKVAGPRRSMPWIRGGPGAFDRANIAEALNGSLQRLGTDYLDLYYLHWPARNTPIFGMPPFNPDLEIDSTPLEETLGALADQVRAGKIRYVGLSNETPWGVMEFTRIARENNLPVVVAIQNAYNLISRMYEWTLAEVGYRENVPLVAYSPLAFGHLSGKYLGATDYPDNGADGRISRFPAFGQRYVKQNVPEAVAAYAAVAKKHNLSPARMALAFVRSRWFVASTIIGATTMAQLEENLGAFELSLAPEVLADIDAIHIRMPNPAP